MIFFFLFFNALKIWNVPCYSNYPKNSLVLFIYIFEKILSGWLSLTLKIKSTFKKWSTQYPVLPLSVVKFILLKPFQHYLYIYTLSIHTLTKGSIKTGVPRYKRPCFLHFFDSPRKVILEQNVHCTLNNIVLKMNE